MFVRSLLRCHLIDRFHIGFVKRHCAADFAACGDGAVFREKLEFFKRQGLLQDAYRLTSRGAEVCDSILAELV